MYSLSLSLLPKQKKQKEPTFKWAGFDLDANK